MNYTYSFSGRNLYEWNFCKLQVQGSEGKQQWRISIPFLYVPIMNPHDWIMLSAILEKEKSNYLNQIIHLKKMIKFYFIEISKMDIELA